MKDRAAYASDQIQKRWGYHGQDPSGQSPEIKPRPGGESLVFLLAWSERRNRIIIIINLRVRFPRAGPPEAFGGGVVRQHRRGRMAYWWRR